MIQTLLLLSGISFFGSCTLDQQPQSKLFIVAVDSVNHPPSLSVGDTLTLRFYGTIGTSACYAFSHFDTKRDGNIITITVWGKYTPADVCATVMIELKGMEYKISTLEKGNYTINIRQPDGSYLQRSVRVE
ncbi:MAG TPA: hypothetical protein VNN76_06005 [Bacteroidota bacterium]|nr:hypothetical protein [Bacteroidota bacterium]